MKDWPFYQKIKKKIFNRLAIFLLIILNSFQTLAASGRVDAAAVLFEAENIHTVLFSTVDSLLLEPRVKLGSGEQLLLQFDELDADIQRRLYYQFVHCDAAWRASDILEIEYFDGFNKVFDAEQVQTSFNTTVDYFHYALTIDTQPLKLSGNYAVCVYDADEERLLVSRPMYVYENLAGIDSRIVRIERSAAQGGDVHNLQLTLRCPQLRIRDVGSEIKLAVWQNHRLDDLRIIDTPAFIRHDQYVYEGGALLSFEAGNEARWADTRDYKSPRMGGVSVHYFEPYFHATLTTAVRPRGYVHRDDFNGAQYIYAYNIVDPATYAADYSLAHFTLASPQGYVGEVYVYGALTNYKFSDKNRMIYDPLTSTYSNILWLKQGLHNFQYINVVDDVATLNTFEGSWADAENDYNIYVYYRPFAADYDRLICIKQHNSRTTRDAFVH